MDDEHYGRYTVREAAIRLGLSEAAVRQRIRRHTLVAERSEGIVYVLLADDTPDKTTANTAYQTVDATLDNTAIMPAARQQFEAIRDEWLAPLVAQITEQATTIGRLETRLEQEQQRVTELEAQLVTGDPEKDELIAKLHRRITELAEELDAAETAARNTAVDTLSGRVSALEAQQAEKLTPASSAPQTATDAATAVPWWQFWRRSHE